jgi:predicted DNA-binding transcriptional regulator AlpA
MSVENRIQPAQLELLREDVVARRLGISTNTLRRMRRRGEGPPPQWFGRLIRYRWVDVEQWLDRRAAS